MTRKYDVFSSLLLAGIFLAIAPNVLAQSGGQITVSKQVIGATAGYVAASRFDFALECSDPNLNTTFSLADQESQTITNVTIEALCRLTETGVPAPATGFRYEPAEYLPSRSIKVQPGVTSSITVNNTLVIAPDPIISSCPTGIFCDGFEEADTGEPSI